MRKLLMRLLLTTMMGALASSNALADAKFFIHLWGDTPGWNDNINMHSTDYQPSGPTDCREYGVYGGDMRSAEISFSLGPPFKGSASRSRYGTLCHRSVYDWITINYVIKLSECAMWVCTTKYWWQIVRDTTTLHHRIEQKSYDVVDSTLRVWFTDASGNDCTESNCP